MRFCTSCGKEVSPNKKFCEYCGTPVEQPAAPASPPAPVIPAVPAVPVAQAGGPVQPSGGSGRIKLVAGVIILLAIFAGIYFIGLPAISRSNSGVPATTPMPPTTATYVPVLYTTVPPYPTEVPGTGITVETTLAYEEKYMQTYNQVYSESHAFTGGQKEVFSQDVSTPPLYIKFNITPKIFYGEKYVDIGLPSEHIVNSSYVSPNAWFKVRVYDIGNSELVEEQGFNKEHGISPKQEFMIRAPGNYRVEMTGNEVFAEVRILTGKS